ncbi:MAG: 2-C-methyl-D-erythritol 2,4-cyclodiphosphate synthase [Candidatus Eremiobacteraeota bacterium]|nr:2-C-methyl-D-erythritol 2,4-cyclodiphosphate synthase [Candidatus Eremiobacteraeota bacterium]
MRIGHGFDAHRLVDGRRFVLGGVEIPFERGALGHSDADALAHAVCDALLGAAALGDLGAHFPDTEAEWKDADSMVLLARCVELVRYAGFGVENVDATIILQHPKLAPHIADMRRRLAEVMRVQLGQVSVKAKTSEGMGYTGDGTGVAVHAVACLHTID